jgi:hypothetical protein
VFHADGRTDITKLIVVFRNFANPPKKENILSQTTNCVLTMFTANVLM